jgi:TonB family protein
MSRTAALTPVTLVCLMRLAPSITACLIMLGVDAALAAPRGVVPIQREMGGWRLEVLGDSGQTVAKLELDADPPKNGNTPTLIVRCTPATLVSTIKLGVRIDAGLWQHNMYRVWWDDAPGGLDLSPSGLSPSFPEWPLAADARSLVARDPVGLLYVLPFMHHLHVAFRPPPVDPLDLRPTKPITATFDLTRGEAAIRDLSHSCATLVDRLDTFHSQMPLDTTWDRSLSRMLPIRTSACCRNPPPLKIKDVRPVDPRPLPRTTVATVVASAFIDEMGRVRDVRILRSVPELDQAAIAAVRQWQYVGRSIMGVPVPVVATVVVYFGVPEGRDDGRR